MKTEFFHKETIKQTIWRANKKEVKEIITSRQKYKDRWDDNRKARNYIKQVNLDEAEYGLDTETEWQSQAKQTGHQS